jgi:flavorubredoxin
MMVFEETTKSLFPSDLFIQPGENRPVISDDLSKPMIELYRGAGIFASEEPVRQATKRLIDLSPNMVFPMHGSCIDNSIFSISSLLNLTVILSNLYSGSLVTVTFAIISFK